MRKFVLFFVVICFQIGFAQNKNKEVDIVSHTVERGETVRMLSKKYLVDPTEIYRINKFAVNGISEGMVLQIPVPRKEPVMQQEEMAPENTSETVAQNETQEAVKYEEPPADKPKAKKEKPAPKKEQPVTVIDRDSQTEHTVEAGETLYSLSRKYGVSVDEIKLSNEGALKKGLQLGQVVKIPSTKALGSNESSIGSTVTPTREVAKEEANPEPKAIQETETISGQQGTISHKVAPKETLYSLSKRYNVTVDAIKSQNPDVEKHGLQIGQTLTISKN